MDCAQEVPKWVVLKLGLNIWEFMSTGLYLEQYMDNNGRDDLPMADSFEYPFLSFPANIVKMLRETFIQLGWVKSQGWRNLKLCMVLCMLPRL